MSNQTTKKKSRTKIWILGFIILFAVLYIYIYIVPRVSDIFVETYVAEYGTLEAGVDADCLFVREETVYKAQSAGSVDRVIGQGRLMRKGSKILTLAGTGYYTESRGVVSYFYDGLENSLTPGNIENITKASLEKTQNDEFRVYECKKKASAGDVIFKIVDNKEWYLLAWPDAGKAEGFEEGHNVTVDFKDGTRLKMKLKSSTDEGGKKKLVLSCNRYYEFFDKYRAKNCRLIRSSRSGILLETSSIAEKDGTKGVYVKDKFGNYNFTPISILAQDGEITVAEKNYFYDSEGKTVSTVKNYDEILKGSKSAGKAEGSEKNVN